MRKVMTISSVMGVVRVATSVMVWVVKVVVGGAGGGAGPGSRRLARRPGKSGNLARSSKLRSFCSGEAGAGARPDTAATVRVTVQRVNEISRNTVFGEGRQ